MQNWTLHWFQCSTTSTRWASSINYVEGPCPPSSLFSRCFVSVYQFSRFSYKKLTNTIKNQEKRSNFKHNSNDSYRCTKDDVFSNKFEPNNSALGILDTQCAFNDSEGLKILTSSKGELYTFDGIHLTFAGANELAQNLMSSQMFKNILGL